MTELLTDILEGITAFVATNIDDLVILMLFFGQISNSFRYRHIFLGQYLGFTALILLSLPGFLGGLIIPKAWIGLLGILPIFIGIKSLIDQDEDSEVQTVSEELTSPQSTSKLKSTFTSFIAPQTYTVAAVTIANGGDNIGIYVPLFANNDLSSLLTILIVFYLGVSAWCGVAYLLSRHPLIAPVLSKYSHAIVPFVLITLGIFILLENKSYQLLGF